ncbi:hypothetical protein V2J09_001143 [Rumex salicifolius]
MQQHLMQMQPMMAAYYSNNVTSDHIQQYLDENKALILKIVESQNSGKINECAENQARLQRNLMYLAAIADAQPQPPTMHSQQYPTSSMMQQSGGVYMQQQQQHQATGQGMSPQALMAARSSMLYSSQQPYAALQQQQSMHSQMGGMSSMGPTILQGEPNNGLGGFSDFGRANVGKQEMGGPDHSRDGSESLYLKSSDE